MGEGRAPPLSNNAQGERQSLTVMVTGGTGFIGFHTVLELIRAGHAVRLLVRSPEKLRRVFEPFGLGDLGFVEGDMTDAASVDRALEGCDAVMHAAALVNSHAKESARVLENNLRGTENVLGGAHRRGIGRMIQVSSTTALFRRDARQIDERSPLGTTHSGYGRSKIECDRYVRRLQEDGAPIYTTYPGTVIGPDDPGLSEAMLGLKIVLASGLVVESTGGIQTVDVRDVARAHVLLLERGGPPDRFLMGGQYLDWRAYGDLLERVTGHRFRRVYAPPVVFRVMGLAAELLARVVPIETPLTDETSVYATGWAPTDDGHLHGSLGLRYRDLHETLYDAVFWLQGAGHVRAGYRLRPATPLEPERVQ